MHSYILFSVTDILAVVKALNNADKSSCHLDAGLVDSVTCGHAMGYSQYRHIFKQDGKVLREVVFPATCE